MKYFTKQLYERMQVSGSLVFPENIEQMNEFKGYYELQGRDFEAEYKERYETIKPYYLKYLPEHLIEHVHNGEFMNNKIPPDNLMAEINQVKAQFDDEWLEVNRQYRDHFQSIRDQLSENVRNMCGTIDFHDARITAVEEIGTDTVCLHLDCSGCFSFQGTCKITFTGVANKNLPIDSVSSWCLYSEVYALENGIFELRILLYPPTEYLNLDEFRIEASDVSVEYFGGEQCQCTHFSNLKETELD